MKIKNLLLFRAFWCSLFLVLAISSFQIKEAKALGISPPEVELNLLAGSAQQKTVRISKSFSDTNNDVAISVQAISDYPDVIKLTDTEFTIPAGKSYYDYTFYVNPLSIPVGTYTAEVGFYQQPPAATGQSGQGAYLGIVSGVIAKISFAVGGDQVLDYKVESAQIQDSEQGKQLFFTYTVSNQGNVDWRPDAIILQISDVKDAENTAEYKIKSTDIKTTEPGVVVENNIYLDHTLIPGEYTATAKFEYQGEEVAQLDTQHFFIYEKGTLDQMGEVLSATSNKAEYKIGEKVKIETTFKNTGELPVQALMVVEVNHDGDAVDLIQTDKTQVDRGEETFFDTYLNTSEPGHYQADTYVEYGNKRTERSTINFQVMKETGFFSSTVISIFGVVVVSLSIFIFIFLKRRKHHVPSSRE